MTARDHVRDIYPLSPMQLGMMFHSLNERGSGIYIEQLRFRFEGLDLDRFRRAWEVVFRRHAVLRTSIVGTGRGDPGQLVRQDVPFPWHEEDLRSLPEHKRDAWLENFLQEDCIRGFELSAPSLMRFTAVRLNDAEVELVWTLHHIILDGWSAAICQEEALQVYDALGRGDQPDLPPVTPFRDYIVWLRKQELSQAEAYWRKTLRGFRDPTPLPFGRRTRGDRHAISSYDIEMLHLSNETTRGLREHAAASHVTLATLLSGAWALLLGHYSGQSDVTFGTTVNVRPDGLAGNDSMVGMFVNTLPMRVQLPEEQSVGEWLENIQAGLTASRAFEYCPLWNIQQWSELSSGQLFDTLFVYHHFTSKGPSSESGLKLKTTVPLDRTGFPIMVLVTPLEELSVRLTYDAGLYDKAAIRLLLGHFESILEAVAKGDEDSLARLTTLGDRERRLVLEEWNDTGRLPAESLCLHQLFERQARKTPDRVAIVHEDVELTYGELDARANSVAHELARHGVGLEQPVGIYLDRGFDLITAILGVLKAGGAYVPLDTAYPADRIAFMMQESRAPVIVTQRSMIDAIREDGDPAGERASGNPRLVCIEDIAEAVLDASTPETGVRPANLAYVLYTSGSTGRPKGVMITHASAAGLAHWARGAYEVDDLRGVLASTSICFDLSVFEIFVPLCWGGSVVLVEDALAVRDHPAKDRVTLMNMVPSAIHEIVREGAVPRSVRTVNLAGEPLAPALVDRIYACGVAQVYDLYGPSEDTTYSTGALRQRGGPETIGRPIAGERVYVVDPQMEPVPIGVPGELLIGGDGLARGYLGRPDLTAEKFIPDPFASALETGYRLYRTGDRVRYRPDGNLEFLGRLDAQIKLRGYRIELGEIETVLDEHAAIQESVVLVREEEGDRRLVAYVVCSDAAEPVSASPEVDSWQAEQVEQWRELYDQSYEQADAPTEATFNIAGWNSSYTGEAIPPDQMREWVERAVERIRATRPQRVLEIGCGTGLLLLRIAPHCAEYVGGDFSQPALDYALSQLPGLGPDIAEVKLERRLADDFDGLEPAYFDTIVLNSVVQYFPSDEYLRRVLDGALELVKPGGRILVGDVRNLALMEPFHTSVQVYRAPGDMTLDQIHRRVQHDISQDQELALDPSFFAELARTHPRISHLEMELKPGRYDNELSRFRYEVTLHVECDRTSAPKLTWISWTDDGMTLERLRLQLEKSLPARLAFSGVPHARVRPHTLATTFIAAPDGPPDVAQLRDEVERLMEQDPGVEPEDLRELAESLGYSVLASVGAAHEDGSFDVVLARDVEAAACRALWDAMPARRRDTAAERTNRPLRGRFLRELVPLLREHANESLPEYMVPSALMVLPEFPLNQNGKIDRRALRSERYAPVERRGSYVAPRGPEELALAEIWSNVLGVASLGVHDDFFELGGHSLTATQVISRVRDVFQVELPVRALFESPTIAQLAGDVRQAEGQAVVLPQPTPVPRDGDLPLSYAQQRVWFLDQLGTGAAYNVPIALRLEGELNVEAMRHGIHAVVQRHETLRSRYVSVDGQPVQEILPELKLPLEVVDFSHLATEQREERLLQVCQEEEARPFDLAEGPILRPLLVRLQEDEHVLLCTIHHIVVDGWSLGVLLREIAEHYRAFVTGEAPRLPELKLQYADYAHWQRSWMRGEALESQLDYWRHQLADLPTLEMPTDHPRPPQQTYAGYTKHFEVPSAVARALRTLSRRHGTSMAMTLLAGFQALLARYTGQTDIVVGSPIANRNRRQIEDLIGFFVNSMVLRGDLSGDPTFGELVRRVKRTSLDAYAHQDIPFERLVDELEPVRDTSRTALFQIMFAVQNAPHGQVQMPGLRVVPWERAFRWVRFDMEMHLWDEAEGLTGILAYNSDLFERATIDRLIGHFVNLLEAVCKDPRARLSSLPLLDAREREELVIARNATTTDYPREACIHALFEEQAAARPDAIAVTLQGQELTYGELNARANKLARHLRELGVGAGTLVALWMERSLEMVVGILGILKAGGAYAPLSTDYPARRVELMLEDMQASVVLTQSHLRGKLPGSDSLDAGLSVIELDGDARQIDAHSSKNLPSRAQAEDLAYVLYTSGSTGVPKGTAVPHRGVVRLVRETEFMDFGPEEVFLQLAPISFDASTLELWGPLLNGGRLALFPPTKYSLGEIAAAVRAEGVTSLWLTAALFHEMVEHELDSLSGVRQLLSGGDVLSVPHVQRVLDVLPEGSRMINGYGPTESTTFTCCHSMARGDVLDGSVPIGRPISNTRVYVVDRDLNPLPIGVFGELLIGGDGLSREYWRRPELTAERFFPDPFSSTPGERLYRTGDIVRWRSDGTIEFRGRVDQQVKLRGYRIELGEIETALREHAAVEDAVVSLWGGEDATKRLAAYLVPAEPAGEDSAIQEIESEHVTEWQSLYDITYGGPDEAEDDAFDIVGWNSSYTGEPIPAEEMREWVEATVERIRSCQPQRVLEIGCGSGLLLHRLAPDCEHYVGTDFSAKVLDQLERYVAARGLDQVELLSRLATDFEGLEPGSFDTVVINSVIQYFPSIEYLVRVIEGAAKAVRAGGYIVLGDVRNLPLLSTLHAAIELFRAPAGMTAEEFEREIRGSVDLERELVVDPDFFHAFCARSPRLGRAQVLLKHGRARNELTGYRYDVILHLQPQRPAPEVTRWMDWEDGQLDLKALAASLIQGTPAVGVLRIPNARVRRAAHLAGLLRDEEHPETVEELRAAMEATPEGLEIEAVRSIAAEHGYACELSYSRRGGSSRMDAVLWRKAPFGAADAPGFPETAAALEPRWRLYANNPVRGHFARRFVPELREYLSDRLPDYMVPATFSVLDAIPRTPNGKVDRRALPSRTASVRSWLATWSRRATTPNRSSQRSGARSCTSSRSACMTTTSSSAATPSSASSSSHASARPA